jgi:hypothetical protein
MKEESCVTDIDDVLVIGFIVELKVGADDGETEGF